MPAKKRSPKTAVKRKTASGPANTHKKAAAKASVKRATPQAKRTGAKKKKNATDTIHDVERTIGSKLGTLAKKTGKAVEAARNALPNPLHSGKSRS